MMTLWSIFRSPMMLGAELPELDDWTLSLITNQRVLYLLENSSHAKEVFRNDKMIVWKAVGRYDDKKYTAIFNIADTCIAVTPSQYADGASGYNLWTDEKIDFTEEQTIDSHDCFLVEE